MGPKKGGRGTETKGEARREEAKREENTHPAEEGVAEKRARQTKVTQKWTKRVVERQAHLNHNPDTRKGT